MVLPTSIYVCVCVCTRMHTHYGSHKKTSDLPQDTLNHLFVSVTN